MVNKQSRTMESRTKGQRIPSFPSENGINASSKLRREHIVSPHVDSFNYFLEYGLAEAIEDIPAYETKIDDNLIIRMKFKDIHIGYPIKKDSSLLMNNKLTPREAREREMSYSAPMQGNISITINDTEQEMNISSRFGDLPIMVMSSRCHLNNLKMEKLLELKEEPHEVGGYFIVNGIERVIRLLQVPRRNYAMALERNSFKNRGSSYSDKGVQMRCVRKDQSSVTITLHYLNNGGATLRFVLRKQEFLLPVVMVAKALIDITDKEFYERVIQNDFENTFLTTRLELLLHDAKQYNIFTKSHARSYLGSLFRNFLPISDRTSDEEAGEILLDRYLFVHIDSSQKYDKAEVLFHMIRKLFSFAQGKCLPDNADALMNHELLLPGHLITSYVKEKLMETLLSIHQVMLREIRVNKVKLISDCKTPRYFQKNFERFGDSLGSKIGSFLSTGNIISSTGMDLMQVSGYTIVAERLNFLRYMSHFQSVHRGQFFTTMKTTLVRKLLPESWGFLCPVHTPDGSPCGLLNHLSQEAVVLAFPTSYKLPTTSSGTLTPTFDSLSNDKNKNTHSWCQNISDIKDLLVYVGVTPSGVGGGDGQYVVNSLEYIPVLVDGIVIGGLHVSIAEGVVRQLRLLKTRGFQQFRLDPTTELAYIPKTNNPGSYPGLYIFTQPGRLIRPVMQLDSSRIEWIGPMEQVYMDIAVLKEDINNYSTHFELFPSIMLSHIASLTPFSDYNQSPRNMYQCQMGKQTMGTPSLALRYRSDNKLFRIQNPQSPIVQTKAHREYCMDEYPQGCNAVVAVISYTGYDMEDAMIINKSSYERGFGHGSVYKTKVIDLDLEEKQLTKSTGMPNLQFCNIKSPPINIDNIESNDMIGEKYCEELDFDGLPSEGDIVNEGSPICCFVDRITGEFRIVKHKEAERAFIQTVRIIGPNTIYSSSSRKYENIRKVSITLRFCRNPIIGDKFSSRHGQKGTLSVLWPTENMPFSESGIFPDVLINPHAFPSRMTIGMLIESMAGKAGAMNGIFQDSTPFQFHEENRVIDYLGEQLKSNGFSYYGSEPLYNGLTGNLMQAEIFIGVVYYQRLRHMVSDKSQVRSIGAVTQLTRQPVKGRKKHGGIRLGEMERDALLSHGVAFCLQDRLMNCSDSHLAYVCNLCGGLISVYNHVLKKLQNGNRVVQGQYCSICKTSSGIKPINLPFVYRYLVNELAGMGIKMTTKLSE